MSFIVQIIDAALPGDATQRQRLIDRLVSEHQVSNAEPGAALAKLYQQLVANFPCLSSIKENAADECVWADGPLITNFGQRLAVLDIAQNQEQVLAHILKLAGELNLKVVDVQANALYYPKSQEAIDFIAAHEKPVVKEKPLSEKSVLEFVVGRLKPVFERGGFVWDKKQKWFARPVAYGEQIFRIVVEKKRDRFQIFLRARLQIAKVEEALSKLVTASSSESYIEYRYVYFTGDFFDPKVENLTELSELASNFEIIVDEKVLPFFEATLSLEKANSLTNNSEKCEFFLSWYEAEVLTLAYLVDPSRIQQTADIYRNYIAFRNFSKEAYQKPIDDIVEKLIALNPTL
ncbi:hypothetical protein RF679_01085 [Undibacterium cyanobacteriorum]|uniref:Uncharacterized protein n=1 Tax=Undibacterium cyanobacteriorum TaxID=3073561 RepID=A0ABY9RKU8_9BURK|nr:hypothetical protein [Undibacterium sp. 20NA77.5]WMW80890.1 hypothetical protein RF679_01085 [Undibacterium sp. 20NA77.5]